MVNRKYTSVFLSAAFFLFSVFISLHYLWSTRFLTEFDSDIAENVIWAKEAVDSGTLFNRDFIPTQVHPFGGQLIFISVVRILGANMTALRTGLSICSVLFQAAQLMFFIGVFRFGVYSFICAGTVSLLISSSDALRNIYWDHVVHYDLADFWLLLSLFFLSMLLKEGIRGKKLYAAGFAVSVVLGSANSSAVVLFFSVTLLCALFLEQFLTGGYGEVRKNIRADILIFLFVAAGIVVGKILTSGIRSEHSSQFTVLSPAAEWGGNLLTLMNNWISMFAKLPDAPVSVFEKSGIIAIIQIFAACFLVFAAARPVFLFGKTGNRMYRLVFCIHWLTCVEILFFSIFGSISSNCWRIIPMFFTSILSSTIVLKEELLRRQCDRATRLAESVFAALVLICCATGVGYQLLKVPGDRIWNGRNTIVTALKKNFLDYGYSTDYWFANSITVFTGGNITVREVVSGDEGLIPSDGQIDTKWFSEPIPGDRFFLIAREQEYWDHPEFAESAADIIKVSQERTYTKGAAGYYIFVYETGTCPEFFSEIESVCGRSHD